MSVLFALAAAVGWGSSDFAAGHASRRSSAVSVVILTHFAAVVALVFVSLVPGQGGSPTVADLGWGLAAGLGGGFGAMLLFRGLGKGSMAVVAPITATGAASIPVFAGVIQGDPITLFSVLGVLLALVAIVMVSLAGDDAEDEADQLIGTASEPNGWAAPRGLPISTLAPRPMFRSEPPPTPAPSSTHFAQVFAPPVAVHSATPPKHAMPSMPAPLQHTSLLADTVSDALPAVPSGAVALLDRPPASAPVLLSPSPRPLAPPTIPAAPPRTSPGSPSDIPVREFDRGDSAPTSVLDHFRSIVRRPGVVDAMLSGIGFGLFFVFISRTAESAGHWPLVSARGISVVMFVAGALLTRSAVLPEKGSRRAVVLAGCLDAAAALFFVLSTRDGLLSVGAVLASLYPAVTIVLARFISNERIVKRQLVGLGLAAVAVSLLAI